MIQTELKLLEPKAENPVKADITDYFEHIRPPLLKQQDKKNERRRQTIERARQRLSDLLKGPGSVMTEDPIDLEEMRVSERLMEGATEEQILYNTPAAEVLPRTISNSRQLGDADIPESEIHQYLRSDLEVSVTSRLVRYVKETRIEAQRKKRQRRVEKTQSQAGTSTWRLSESQKGESNSSELLPGGDISLLEASSV